MMQLNRLMLAQYTNDSMVDPYQSSWFGETDEKGEIRDLIDTDLYKEDKIGLKTLHEEGRIDFVTFFATPVFSHLLHFERHNLEFLDFLYNADRKLGEYKTNQ